MTYSALFPAGGSIIDGSILQGFEMNRFFVACAAIGFVLMFSGCGQSGPLYLPGDPSRIESVPPTPADTDEEEEEEDEAPKR